MKTFIYFNFFINLINVSPLVTTGGITPESKVIKSGYAHVFYCNSPVPAEWTKNNVSLPPHLYTTYYLKTNTLLIFDSVIYSDSGDYTCSYEHDYVIFKQTVTLTVIGKALQ